MLSPEPVLLHPNSMRWVAWIWFAGFAVWTIDGAISLWLHAPQHAQLAFLVAMVFLAAGLFYRRQQR